MKNYDLAVLPENEEQKSDVEVLINELRSNEAIDIDYHHHPVGLSPNDWADWLEVRAKELGLL